MGIVPGVSGSHLERTPGWSRMIRDWAKGDVRLQVLLIVIVLSVLGAALRLLWLGEKTIWLDEAYSIWLAEHSPVEIGRWLITIDHHPPLYYLLLHGWLRLWGDGAQSVRLLSALCSILTVPIFFFASRRFFDTRIATYATLLLAIAPFHIHYAQEARMYALMTLCGALAFYFLVYMLTTPFSEQRWGMWLGLAVSEALLMWTHNTAVVLFPVALNVGVLSLLVWRWRTGREFSLAGLNDRGFLVRWLWTQFLAFALWSPWLFPFIEQIQVVDRTFWIPVPSIDHIWLTFHNFNFAHLPGSMPLYSLWDFVVWGLAVVGVYSQRRRPGRVVILLTLFLVPPLIELLVSVRRPIFYDRPLIWTTLPYYLLVAVDVGWLTESMSHADSKGSPQRRQEHPGRLFASLRLGVRPIGLLCALMIPVGSSVALGHYYVGYEKEAWADAAGYVAGQVEPNDVILYNAGWVQLPFDYYFRAYEEPVQRQGLLRQGLPVHLFERGELEPRMDAGDLPTLRAVVDGRARVWLVYSHEGYTDPERLILHELLRSMEIAAIHHFEGIRIFLFKPRV